MRGVNKAIIVGNLGKDPETRYMPNGNAITNVTVATSESWKDKDTGQQKEQTEWHRVVFHGKLAEIAGEFLKKGSKVYIEGSIHTRKWQDKATGQDKYATEIKAATMQMLDSRPAGQGGGSQGEHAAGGSFPSYEDFCQTPARQQPQQQRRPAAQQQQPMADFDDDIPF